MYVHEHNRETNSDWRPDKNGFENRENILSRKRGVFLPPLTVMWMSPMSTEKYDDVPDGVVPCSPGAR
jgi:hypothetical protein